MIMQGKKNTIPRKQFLKTMGICCGAFFAGTMLPGLLNIAFAAPGGNIRKILKKHFGNRRIKMSNVSLKIPIIAENGAVVPIRIVTDLPMRKDKYVKKMYLFVDNNTNPYIASVTLTPETGNAEIKLKIKMRKTSNVRAIAVMNDGSLYGDIKSIKVTKGGCGG